MRFHIRVAQSLAESPLLTPSSFPPPFAPAHTLDILTIIKSIVARVHTSLVRHTFSFGDLHVCRPSTPSVRDNLLVRFHPTCTRPCPCPDPPAPRGQVN